MITCAPSSTPATTVLVSDWPRILIFLDDRFPVHDSEYVILVFIRLEGADRYDGSLRDVSG